jgi:hypothetical protein
MVEFTLDTDIGSDVDDLMVLAMVLGSEEMNLRAATTVYGDTDLIGAPVSGFPFFEAAVGVGDCEKTWAEHLPRVGVLDSGSCTPWVTAARFVDSPRGVFGGFWTRCVCLVPSWRKHEERDSPRGEGNG